MPGYGAIEPQADAADGEGETVERTRLIHGRISFSDHQKTALIFGDSTVTFKQLERKSNQLAHELVKLGVVVGSGKPVGVCCDGEHSIYALLAVLKTGNPYVPLDVSYPRQRVRFMAENSEVDLILTTEDVAASGVLSNASWYSGKLMMLNNKSACWSNSTDDVEVTHPKGVTNMICCILYTSGSTGNPKGVLITHKCMLNRFEWMWKKFPFKAGEVMCQKTSYNFVDSIWELFGGLNKGVPLVLTPREIRSNPFAMIDMIAHNNVTRFVAVPALLRMMLTARPDLGKHMTKLKLLTISGEALPSELCVQLFEVLPQTQILNLYGSTEVAGDVTCAVFTKDTIPAGNSAEGIMPIGHAISNCNVCLLDDSLAEVDDGIEGEIFVFGANIAAGYHRRPEAEAAQFLTLKQEPGERRKHTRCDASDDGAVRAFRSGDFAIAQQSVQVSRLQVQ
jgi:amino acid adenylation domain-containing protein